jgi:hypothetical protein
MFMRVKKSSFIFNKLLTPQAACGNLLVLVMVNNDNNNDNTDKKMNTEYNEVLKRNKELNSNSDYQKLCIKLNSILAWTNYCTNVSLNEACEIEKEISEIRKQLFKFESQIA